MRIIPASEASFVVAADVWCVFRVSVGGDDASQNRDIRRMKAIAMELD
jgi:hypothetical protein